MTAGHHPTALTLAWAALAALVLIAAASDMRQRRIPNRLVLLGAASAVAQQALLPAGLHPASGLHPGTPGLAQGLLAAGLMLLISGGLWQLNLWGAGDAKWLTVLAAHSSPGLALLLLVLTLLCGGALALVWVALRLRGPMPYAVAIAAGEFALMLTLTRMPA